MEKTAARLTVPQVDWQEERCTLTLEGEPVLEYVLSWPQVRGGGLGGRWISRYYARLARAWRLRWQREVYWKACIQLADRRAAARPFTPWQAELKGELTHLADGLLSLRLEGVEIRGDGKPCRVRWGDTWKLREGAPCPLRELFQGEKGWKRRILTHILQQGNARRAAGDCLLDPGWEWPARKNLPQWDYCLNQETAEFAYPQCVIAPAAEGTPVFQVPLRPADAEHRDLPDPLQ